MDFKRILPIAVIGVAVLVLVIYAVSASRTPNQSTVQTPAPMAGQPGATQNTTSDQAQTQVQVEQPPLPDKPVSSKQPATLVPEGTDLKQYCEKYYVAWKGSDWKTAFELLPIAKKSNSDADALGQQLQGYGMVDYEVGEPEIKDHVGTVTATLDLGQNGTWRTIWTFIKNDKGQWTVQESKTGMGQ